MNLDYFKNADQLIDAVTLWNDQCYNINQSASTAQD
jgi:hypothetical protein